MECDPQCEKMEDNMITCYGPVRATFGVLWPSWLLECAKAQAFFCLENLEWLLKTNVNKSKINKYIHTHSACGTEFCTC